MATPYRHGSKEKAEAFFLNGMTQAMHRLAEQTHPGFPVTIYYAFKQSESDDEEGTASTGWGRDIDWREGQDLPNLDVALLLRMMWEQWNPVFRLTLGHTERSLVSELRNWRNKWAHQEPFTSNDADRALDSMARLLTAG